MGGPEMAPHTPRRSERPGGAVALLWGRTTRPTRTTGGSMRGCLRVAFFGAGAVVFLIGGHLGHEIEQAPVALGLAGTAAAADPHILEGLVVARPPPLLALEVVVGGI